MGPRVPLLPFHGRQRVKDSIQSPASLTFPMRSELIVPTTEIVSFSESFIIYHFPCSDSQFPMVCIRLKVEECGGVSQARKGLKDLETISEAMGFDIFVKTQPGGNIIISFKELVG